MDLRELILQILNEQVNPLLLQLKEKYVGEGKLFSEDEFKQVEDVTGNKWYLIAWLTKRVAQNLIKKEDIYKWKEYFQIYEKNKNKFEHKDLNLYKSAEDMQKLLDNIIQVREGDIKFEEISTKDNFVSQSDIEKMEAGGGIKYIGIWKPSKGLKDLNADGYQVFDVSEPTEQNWKLYRDILGRCKGRNRGAKIDICTIGNFGYFQRYLKNDKGSSYFVLFNLNDPMSPYQLHVESSQFMNKNDSERYNFPVLPFYLWLSKTSPKYNFDYLTKHLTIEIPVPGKGYEDEKGKQGEWEQYEDGYKMMVRTLKNGKENGLVTTYYDNGNVDSKFFSKNGKHVGEYVRYSYNGDLIEKGNYDKKGDKQGIWMEDINFRYIDEVTKAMINYDTRGPISGLTKDNTLRMVTDPAIYPFFRGKIVTFYEDGRTKAIGRLTPANNDRTGNWKVFFKDGTIKAEGKFVRDQPRGPWTFVFTRKGKKYVYKINFGEEQKGKLYDSKGNFIKKIGYWKEFIPRFSDIFKI